MTPAPVHVHPTTRFACRQTVCAILASVPTSHHRNPPVAACGLQWPMRSGRVSPAAKLLCAALACSVAQAKAAPDALTAQLRSWIEHLPPRRSPLADDAGRAGLKATEAWLVDTLTQMGYTPRTMPLDWTPDRLPRVPQGMRLQIRPAQEGRFTAETVPNPQPLTWRNVIVEIPGTTRPEEIVVVGAHFDSVPTTPGADDNGSGTAALLAIAQQLKGRRFDRTVQLAFYNLEEVGLVGSRAHAQQLQQRAQR
ncbi:MAG: Zn-dependent exopeptidase M28, partial [Planctomycetota bacterium]